MEIAKSSRHKKIAGDFGEMLVLYWLSKYGFECAGVDHTGIDLIARHPNRDEVMGISIKCRTRLDGQEGNSVKLTKAPSQFEKIRAACNAFKCVPYLAFVVDADKSICVYIVSLDRALTLYPCNSSEWLWKMSSKHQANYASLEDIFCFELQTETRRWWGRPAALPKGAA
jgi:hypothetical protein